MTHAPIRCSLAALLLLSACKGDDARQHVYSSPPPARRAASAAPAPVIVAPDALRGAAAMIEAVRALSTGRPVSLSDVAEPIELLALVRRGEGTSRDTPLTIELRVAGQVDTTLAERLAPPVPVIVAHAFRLPVGARSGELGSGRYTAELRLVAPGGRVLARSAPLPLVVRVGP